MSGSGGIAHRGVDGTLSKPPDAVHVDHLGLALELGGRELFGGHEVLDVEIGVVADDDVGTGSGDEEAVTPQADGELFAPEIKYLSFEYFDGAEWRDRWQFAADAADDAGMGEYDGQGLEDFGDDPRVPPPSGGQVPDENSYALPQAVRITIGRVPVEPEDERMGFGLFDDERDELREHHPDRFTIVVPLLTADRTLLSSRQYGVSDSISRQEGGMR